MATESLSGLSKPVGNALELINAADSFLNKSPFPIQTTGETRASFFDSRIVVIRTFTEGKIESI